MNILFYGLNLNPPWVEGLRNTVKELATMMKNKGHNVCIITKGIIGEPEEENINGITYFRIPTASTSTYNDGSIKFIIKSLSKIKTLTEKYDVDVVHGHSSYPLIGIAEKFSRSAALFTLYSRLGSNSKMLEYNVITNYLLSFAKSRFVASLLKKAVDHVTCITPSIYESLPSNVKSISSIIPIGVNTERFNPSKNGDKFRDELGIEDEKLIFMIGDVTPWKGSEVFIKAAKKVASKRQDVNFVLFAKGTYEFERERLEKLKNMVKAYNLEEKIYFAGVYNNIEEIYAAADIAVFPYIEAFALMSIPLSLLEVMALGKPIIASKVGDMDYAIRNGVDGRLVNPGSVKELANALIFLLEHEDESRKMGMNAWSRVKKNFDWNTILGKYITLYNNIIIR